jgi:tetratricopeptide (TPR) repeat protein
MLRILRLFIFLFPLLPSCRQAAAPAETELDAPRLEAISLRGDSLFAPQPSARALATYDSLRLRFDSLDVEQWIWLGRWAAYTGEHQEAIRTYTAALERFPEDARLYRHRGHRYITTRQLDRAISDFLQAADLIAGKPDEVEPDGMPNARNIPVSTLHTNVWYHLGLAYYLKNDLSAALEAYEKGLEACENDDMRVSFWHWKYMALRQLGQEEAAQHAVAEVHPDMEVVESFDYWRLCLFYHDAMTLEELQAGKPGTTQGSSEALLYGIGNWHFYHHRAEVAETVLRDILRDGNWAAFGYIAAEAALSRIESEQ